MLVWYEAGKLQCELKAPLFVWYREDRNINYNIILTLLTFFYFTMLAKQQFCCFEVFLTAFMSTEVIILLRYERLLVRLGSSHIIWLIETSLVYVDRLV